MLRKTLYPQYWTQEFALSEQDLDFVYRTLSQGDLGTPAPFDRLAVALIEEIQRVEDTQVQKLLALGTMYRPKEKYDVGQMLVFTALDYRTGTVTDLRPGQNPEHGRFQVATVELSEPAETVEFASQLRSPHPLNGLEVEELNSAELMSAEEIYEQYEDEIRLQIVEGLERARESLGIVEWHGGLLIEDQLIEIDEFGRNVAEAMMYEAGKPVAGEAIMEELRLDPGDASQEVIDLSLEVALTKDERFELVVFEGEERWFARALLPDPVREIPDMLRPVPLNYQFSALEGPLLTLEVQLRDEWSELPTGDPVDFASCYLLQPHLLTGSMPVNAQAAALLDSVEERPVFMEITDPLTGDDMPVWYVPKGRYVCGLGDFYLSHKITVGTRLTLEKKANGKLTLSYNRRRANREWQNIVDVEEGQLHFKLEKSKNDIAHEFLPELMVITQSETTAWEEYRARQQDTKVFLLVEELVKELVKGNGTVNAATVYAAVNLIQRHAPGPVFHALLSNSRLTQLDDQVTWKLA